MDTTFILILFVIVAIALIAIWVSYNAGKAVERSVVEKRIKIERGKAVEASRATLGGKFVEQLAPYLPEFKYDPTEARFIGTPIDLVVFPGLSQNAPEKVVFLEVKTGSSKPSSLQRRIRQLIEGGRVEWELIRRPAPE